MPIDPCEKAREAVAEATRNLISAAGSTSDADQQAQDVHDSYQKALEALDECESEATKFAHENTKPTPHRPVKR